ncbi:MAG: rhodanese-like domain-containing protein [Pyrinomonadaceae bacterium]|nr:rhodanese-like domain-containing protein [Pyrinomonadaceae bacterium]
MSECTVLTLNEKLENDDINLLDVREPAEFAGGRIPGAKLLPLGELEKRQSEIDHSKPIYVMCRSGNRSAQAQQKLKKLGFTNVINVSGGFEAWKKHDLPFDRDENAPWAIERQVRFVAGLLVLTGFALSFLNPYFILISAFVGAGLAFSAVTDTCTMGMILLKMPWNKRAIVCETNKLAAR